jgi:lipopolysaccharide transport system ATP-binding protein
VGTGFHPELTGRENIYLNGAILGMRRHEIARKFDEIVDFSGVEKYLEMPVKRFSSGMYVRLAFAVAAHLEPEILLVDEVLAVGDAEFQKKCLGKMGAVAGEGRTVLFVSHNMAAIEVLCDKSIYLNNGHIGKIGDTKQVIDKYLASTSTRKTKSRIFKGLINWLKIINKDGSVCDVIKAGDQLIFQILIDTKDIEIENPVIGIGIDNSVGTRIFTVGTYFSHKRLMPIRGKKIVECNVQENLLVPGIYSIKVALGNSFTENIEEIENVMEFEIEPSDFFGNGKLPNKAQGVVLVKSDWEIKKYGK